MKFGEPGEELGAVVDGQPGQFFKDLSFAHGVNLARRLFSCKHGVKRCGSSTAVSFSVRPSDFFGAAERQVVFTGHDAFAGLGFEFQAGAFGNFPASLRGGLVLGHAGGGGGLGNLAGGELARAVKMSSASLMWSRRFWVLSPFKSLWALTLTPLHS